MADSDPDPRPLRAVPLAGGAGTFTPFRYPAFSAIWIANLVSNLGSMIQSVAAAWLMTDLTRSHVLIALVQASATVPILLFGVFAGAIADNFDRRRVMLVAQIFMLVASAALALIDWRGELTPWLLLGFTFAVGIGTALNAPAWQASVRQQVGPRDLPQAIALNTIAFNLARCAGPALGGLLISIWNVSLAFAVNAVSYLALVVVLLRWRPGHAAPRRLADGDIVGAGDRRSILTAVVVGIRYCAGSPPIRMLLLRAFVVGFGVAGYQALIPAVVRGPLGGNEIQFGILLGLFGIGSICVALFVGRLRARFGPENVLSGAMLAFAGAQVVLAHAHSLIAAAPGTFIAGAGWVTGLTTLNVTMQLRSPEAILGRCLSLYQAAIFGGMALGAWGWGALADSWGLSGALYTAAAFLVVSALGLRRLTPMAFGAADAGSEAMRSPP